jgi:hypothetical protein
MPECFYRCPKQILQSCAVVLIATVTRTHALPGGIAVETIESSQWVKVRKYCIVDTIASTYIAPNSSINIITSTHNHHHHLDHHLHLQIPLRRVSVPSQIEDDDRVFELLKQ